MFAPEVNCLCQGPQVEGLQGASQHSVVPQYSPSTQDKERRIRDGILLLGEESKEVNNFTLMFKNSEKSTVRFRQQDQP